MAQVIDASVAVAWCVPSQGTVLSNIALTAVYATGGHVPAQFWFEVVHSLDRTTRRGLITKAAVEDFLLDLTDLSLTFDAAYTGEGILSVRKLAQQYHLSIYDASYLELSLRLGVPLATHDRPLARAAEAAGVVLFTN
jgi:predicted nucleic acid-binding protein